MQVAFVHDVQVRLLVAAYVRHEQRYEGGMLGVI
jgi:hypothetical protein